MKKNLKTSKVILYVITIAVVAFAIYLIFFYEISDKSLIKPTWDINSAEDCKQKTGKQCNFAMCDYIPEGMTIEEACGKNFQKGWYPEDYSFN